MKKDEIVEERASAKLLRSTWLIVKKEQMRLLESTGTEPTVDEVIANALSVEASVRSQSERKSEDPRREQLREHLNEILRLATEDQIKDLMTTFEQLLREIAETKYETLRYLEKSATIIAEHKRRLPKKQPSKE